MVCNHQINMKIIIYYLYYIIFTFYLCIYIHSIVLFVFHLYLWILLLLFFSSIFCFVLFVFISFLLKHILGYFACLRSHAQLSICIRSCIRSTHTSWQSSRLHCPAAPPMQTTSTGDSSASPCPSTTAKSSKREKWYEYEINSLFKKAKNERRRKGENVIGKYIYLYVNIYEWMDLIK